jgi:Carboxypeptidase regulatory-like domain
MVKRFAIFVLVVALASFALAQGNKKSKEPTEKSVSGIVTDENDKPVPGAVVQLKNTKTLQVRSFIAREMGDYYFHGLATDVDYELKAEANGQSSGPRILSSFDTHAEAKINLQLKK